VNTPNDVVVLFGVNTVINGEVERSSLVTATVLAGEGA
jgi:hypothetical protein